MSELAGREIDDLAGDRLVGQVLRKVDRVDVVDAEGEHVLVGDGVDDRVGVQLVAEGLLRRAQARAACGARVRREDRRPGEAEQVVALEGAGDGGVHIAELGAVALVEDDDDMPVEDGVALVGGRVDEGRELLDRRDDDAGLGVAQLLLELGGRRIRVGRALLEAVVLAHRLVVEVLAVDDEEHLVDPGHSRRELSRLEAREGLA